ncbi:MAG TPA: hypothetical protein VMU50_19805, partial [Polyangia bacterium]|nr:hypothetical protein [Polyangia bacterium]
MMPQTARARATFVGFFSLAVSWAAIAAPWSAAAAHEPETGYAVAIRLRGPVALVDVTRALSAAPGGRADAAQALIDLTLPPRAALLSVEVKAAAARRWQAVPAVDARQARAGYAAALQARGLLAVDEEVDAGATHRVRVLWTVPPRAGAAMLRYRFSALLEPVGERLRLCFPASAETAPAPAAVTVAAVGARDLALPGGRIAGGGGSTRVIHAAGQAPPRAGWEVSYLPIQPPPAGALVAGSAAAARLPGGEHALAVV